MNELRESGGESGQTCASRRHFLDLTVTFGDALRNADADSGSALPLKGWEKGTNLENSSHFSPFPSQVVIFSASPCSSSTNEDTAFARTSAFKTSCDCPVVKK